MQNLGFGLEREHGLGVWPLMRTQPIGQLIVINFTTSDYEPHSEKVKKEPRRVNYRVRSLEFSSES